MDSSSLKAKIAASIVAISSIHLLKVFMNAPNTDNDKIKWYVLLHMTFVISAFAMGLLDILAAKANQKPDCISCSVETGTTKVVLEILSRIETDTLQENLPRLWIRH